MNFELKKEKVKHISYLINKFLEQNTQFNIPRYCFLIGAGCSISSNITSGAGIINICQKLSYLNNHEMGFQIKNKVEIRFMEMMSRVDEFVKKNESDFNIYVTEKEKQFRQKITKENICDRLPQNIYLTYKSNFGEVNFINKLYDDFIDRIAYENLYGNWFEEFSEDRRERQHLIENIIEKQITSEEYLIFSNLIRKGYIKNVFTTNFDDLINETLLSFYDCKAVTYSHNEAANYITIGNKRPNIIKLHGDYLFENIKNITSETGILESNMLKKFKEFLSSLDLIVVGYVGSPFLVHFKSRQFFSF